VVRPSRANKETVVGGGGTFFVAGAKLRADCRADVEEEVVLDLYGEELIEELEHLSQGQTGWVFQIQKQRAQGSDLREPGGVHARLRLNKCAPSVLKGDLRGRKRFGSRGDRELPPERLSQASVRRTGIQSGVRVKTIHGEQRGVRERESVCVCV
jgi:hypothetical protein